MSVVSSELRICAFEGRIAIGFRFLNPRIQRNCKQDDAQLQLDLSATDMDGRSPVTVRLLGLVVLRRIL